MDCVLTQIQNLKQTYCNLSLGAQKKITNGYGAGFCEGVREAFSKQDQEKEKEWSLILRLPKEVIDFCDKFDTAQGNMYDTPIDFRKFSSGYLDGNVLENRNGYSLHDIPAQFKKNHLLIVI